MNLPSVIIASLALVFTVGSFYWLQARKGKLKLYPVTTFSGAARNETFMLRLPIILHNTGAIPRVVTCLRLTWQGDSSVIFECHSFRKTVEPTSDDGEDFAHPFAIPGRGVVTKHAHFVADDFSRHLTDQPSVFDLEAWVDDKTEWEVIGSIQVHTEIMYKASYFTYSNNPGIWQDDIKSDAQRHRERLAANRRTFAALPDDSQTHGKAG